MSAIGRCLVLNGTYEFHDITNSWYDGVRLVMKGRAIPLACYDGFVNGNIEVPSVVVLKRVVPRRQNPMLVHPTKKAILVRDRFKCQYCGKPLTMSTMTKDHVFPLSRGGKDVITNVVAACKTCNNVKRDRTPDEAKMTLIAKPRHLTHLEKDTLIAKTHRSHERAAWFRALGDNKITMFLDEIAS